MQRGIWTPQSIPSRTRRQSKDILQALILVALALVVWAPGGLAQNEPAADLSKASLEDLMNIEVTSASKKEQKLLKVPAAMFVITQDDIRRSGATTVPDLLRMVPGLDVAQINANTWAISARGFNGQFANKMLVMIDGRTVYDPSFSGVYWDAQDLVLEDVDRIEVIRGPGATIWGANAVNGVINIITKAAKDTQGALVTSGGGNVEQGFGTIRYGGKLGKRGAYRVFGKYFNRPSFDNSSGANAADAWDMKHGGFRMDWVLSDRTSATIQGDIYGGEKGEPYPAGPSLTPPFATPPFASIKDYSGGNLLTRWNHTLQGGSEMSAQVYFDRISRVDRTTPELRSTFDIEFQHHLKFGSRHDIVWGIGYRSNSDHLPSDFMFSFNPVAFQSSIENEFIQDEIELVRDRVWLTAGTKFEHNVYTGFELEPSLRLLWALNKRHTLWTAFSEADRTPARDEEDVRVNTAAFPTAGGLVALESIFGNTSLSSEEIKAFEIGYRFEPSKKISLDVASFYNRYHNLRTYEPGAPFLEATPAPPHLEIPIIFGEKALGATYGAEASVTWKVTTWWRVLGGYAWFVPSVHLLPSSLDTTSLGEIQGETPRNQFQVRSQLNLPHRFEFDNSLDRVGRLAEGPIPAYIRFDTRLGWHAGRGAELDVVGQNLFKPEHLEFQAPTQIAATDRVRRSFYGSITWRF